MYSLLLHRALRRVTLIIPTKKKKFFFTLQHLKLLQHVSILRSSSGSHIVPC